MNSYELSRNFWDFAFENPDKIKPIHSAIYFFAIEHCNRLGWKERFGLPSQMVMEAIGVKNWKTYSNGLKDLVEFRFLNMIEKSTNQYSSNIVAIVNFTKADTKALDKALSEHSQKQSTKQAQSIVSIDKQLNNKTINNKTIKPPSSFDEFFEYAKEKKPRVCKHTLRLKYESWLENDWHKEVKGKSVKIINWKSTLLNTLPYIKETEYKPTGQITL